MSLVRLDFMPPVVVDFWCDEWARGLMDVLNQLQRLEQLRADETLAAIGATLQREVERLGFRNFVYWLLWPEHGPRRPLYVTNYPDEWLKRHLALNYDAHDLVGRWSAQIKDPFLWALITRHRHITPPQRIIFDEGGEFGIRAGASIPLHGPGRAKASFCVSINGSDEEFAELFMAKRMEVVALARCAHERIRSFNMDDTTETSNLSPHEIEALTWAARGRTRRQIAQEMNVSDETVKTHLHRARDKLGASNNTQAVATAVLRAIILPE